MQGGLGGGTVSMRPGIGAGESYVREVAAYILVSLERYVPERLPYSDRRYCCRSCMGVGYLCRNFLGVLCRCVDVPSSVQARLR